MSPNRQRPLAGAGHAAIFNVFRRFRHQVLYVAPPFIAAYAIMNWAVERYASPLRADLKANIRMFLVQLDIPELTLGLAYRNEYLNSKPGRLLEGGDE
ncbi:hypothetical protein ASPTUDRAFT_37971 [Aspergillus tubingensis CBS 134.48]|uniref:Cytochrome b-c1 complex subunit 8 n=1 Tax=Aspergillus tubingensis (strain CBS 134.48) TaxID=767770 RepID=A0A1L9NPN8_ASPTC|nr:hypothetical protein ASPTUDRAFT_37971 [Aspergillus tubingensis CBS 134.48]